MLNSSKTQIKLAEKTSLSTKIVLGIGMICAVLVVATFSALTLLPKAEKVKKEYQFSYSFSFQEPTIGKTIIADQEYDTIATPENLSTTHNIGQPVIPITGSTFLIPQGHKITKIKVTPQNLTSLGAFLIEPAQKPLPTSSLATWYSNNEEEIKQRLQDTFGENIPSYFKDEKGEIMYDLFKPTAPDQKIYGQDGYYPEKTYLENLSSQYKRGYQLVTIQSHPYRYNPATKELFYYPIFNIQVTTQFDLAEKPHPNFRNLVKDAQEVAMLVVNPEALATYIQTNKKSSKSISSVLNLFIPRTKAGSFCKPSSCPEKSYQYIIITTTELSGNFDGYDFNDLINHKLTREDNPLSSGTIITTEDIYANYNGLRPDGKTDNQTRIRQFIIDAYQNWETEYVLLGGQAAYKTVIPLRYLYSSECADGTPADLYYSNLDGTWDNNGNGIYGEIGDNREIDDLAEVYVGRAPIEGTLINRKDIIYSNGFTWSGQDAPQTTELYDVYADDLDHVWAVGRKSGNGVILFYDGSSWSKQVIPDDVERLNGISGVTSSSVWAVGQEEGQAAIIRNNSGAWLKENITISGVENLYDVSVMDATHVWAVGEGGGKAKILYYSGSEWVEKIIPEGVERLYGVSALDATHVWAVGEGGGMGIVLFYNGASWSKLSIPEGIKSLRGISAFNQDQVWVVGQQEEIRCISADDGIVFNIAHQEHLEKLGSFSPFGVFVLDPSHIWVSGANGIFFYDGSDWTRQYEMAMKLNSIFALDPSHIWSVGVSENIVNGEITVGNFVEKTILYENSDQADFVEGGILDGEALGFAWGGEVLDSITNNGYLHQYSLLRTHADVNYCNMGGHSVYWVRNVNYNQYQLVLHDGHTSNSNALGVTTPKVNSILNNQKPILIYSQGCFAGDFRDGGNIGSAFVGHNDAAFAFIGNSCYGLSNESPGYMESYARILSDETDYKNNGYLLTRSKEETFALEQLSFETFYQLNLLGDPETPIFSKFTQPKANLNTILLEKDEKYHNKIDLMGTAKSGYLAPGSFSDYRFEYGFKHEVEQWLPVDGFITLENNDGKEVDNGKLATLNVSAIPPGGEHYGEYDKGISLRLLVQNNLGETTFNTMALAEDDLDRTPLPQIELDQSPILFKDAPLGQLISQTLTVKNAQSATAELILDLSLEDYSKFNVNPKSAVINPGEEAEFTLTYTADSNQHMDRTNLSISHNDPYYEDNPVKIPVEGYPAGYNLAGWPVRISTDFAVAPKIKIEDIDNDKNAEVIVAAGNEGIYVYKYNGDPYGTAWPYLGSTNGTVTVANLDNSGEKEIISAIGNKLLIFDYQGNIKREVALLDEDFQIKSMIVADLDNDNFLEVVLNIKNLFHSYLYSYNFNDDKFSFIYDPQNAIEIKMSTADFDHNGDLELVIFSFGSTSTISLIHHNGTIYNGDWPKEKKDPPYWGLPIIADLDNDQELEIIGYSNHGGFGHDLYVWKADGSQFGDFAFEKAEGLSQYLSYIAVADLDPSHHGLEIILGGYNGVAAWHTDDGTLLDNWPVIVNGKRFSNSVVIAEIDGQDGLDVIAETENSVYVWHSDGSQSTEWLDLESADDAKVSPLITNIDNDQDLEVLFGGYRYYKPYYITIYAFPTGGSSDYQNLPWPITQHDVRDTGLFNQCSDYTQWNSCSDDLPLFCLNGALVNKCSLCHCPDDFACLNDESCSSSAKIKKIQR